MAAHRMAELDGPRASGLVGAAAVDIVSRATQLARATACFNRRWRIGMPLTITALLVAGSELLLSFWLVAALAAGAYGLAAFAR